MADTSTSAGPGLEDQARYQAFTGAGKQSFKSSSSESKQQRSFWSVLAKRAKAALLDDGSPTDPELHTHSTTAAESKPRRTDAPVLQKGFVAITSSLSVLGGTIGNAIEEGLNIVEAKATDFISSDSSLLFTKKKMDSARSSQQLDAGILEESAEDKETQLKASRDVAMAMAAKAKLLLRELKTAKADLVIAKDRCMQLEEENKRIRESLHNGLKLDEEDLVRIQLETLLAEKARLAQENAYYARENQILREVLEYHQFSRQNVVSLDEGIMEVAELVQNPNTEEAEEHPLEPVISHC